MKCLIVRVEDQARGEHVSLLEGAKATHLQHLAQAGAGGALRPRGTALPLDRMDVHRGLLGLDAEDPAARPAHWYAAAKDLRLPSGATAWCCELLTHADGKVVDPTAGRITTRESEALLATLNDKLGSDQRRWHLGDGAHHVLVTHDAQLAKAERLHAPEQLAGTSWKHALPRGAQREPLRKLLDEAAKILETHPINRVRVDLGENPANALWLWGAAGASDVTAAPKQNGAILGSAFPLAGAAKILGMEYVQTRPATDETAFTALAEEALRLAKKHHSLYVHLAVAAEQPVDRLVAMERLDQLVLRRLTETLPGKELRLLVVVDERPAAGTPPPGGAATAAAFVAYGAGLPQQPVSRPTGDGLTAGASFEDPLALHAWFTKT